MTKRKIKTPGVYLDNNGTYYLKYKNKTYRGFKTVEDAEIKKAQLRLTPDVIKSVKFSVVIQEHLDHELKRVDSQEITYGTYMRKESTSRIYITDKLGGYTMNELTPKIIRDFRDSLIALKVSTTTKNKVLNVLKALLGHANRYFDFDKDLTIYLDPFPKTKNEKKESKERLNYIWDNSDFDRFTRGLDNQQKLMFRLFFHHGLRLGEAQALRFCDVDFDKNLIDINGSISRKTTRGQVERKQPKTTSSERVIFVGRTTDLIKEIQNEVKALYNYNEEWYICGSQKPMPDKAIDYTRKKHIKEAGLKDATNHELRHMFVTNAWSAGVPITAISKYIGHKNVSVTLSVYSHLTQKDNDKMNDYILKTI